MKFLYWFIITVCLLFMFRACCFAEDCKGLSPELQKAYEQLKKSSNGDFTVSCRKGI